MNPKLRGKLPPGQPCADPGSLQAGQEAGRRRPKRVVSKELDDLGDVVNVRIEVMVLPGIDRRGPNADLAGQIRLA